MKKWGGERDIKMEVKLYEDSGQTLNRIFQEERNTRQTHVERYRTSKSNDSENIPDWIR